MVRNTHGITPLPKGWLDQAQKCFQSHSKINDILFVYADNRSAGRILINVEQKEQCVALITQLGLEHSFASAKIKNIDTHNYSNAGMIDSHGEWELLYFAKTKATAQQACEAEQQGEHTTLGKLLGYPSCCQYFFSNHYDRAENKDLALQLLDQKKSYNTIAWTINPFARYFDFCAISHFPCSAVCKESLTIAKKNILLLKSLRPEFCKALIDHLRSPIIYEFEEEPVFHLLLGSKIIGKSIVFKRIKSTRTNAFSQTLAKKRVLDFSPSATTLKSHKHTLIIPCKVESSK